VAAAASPLVLYISGHGWGHASRAIELLDAMAPRAPDLRLLVRTAVNPALLARTARARLELHAGETDTGIVQLDSLTMDEEETARCAARFYREFDARVDREAAFLAEQHASLVVADVPPLAIAAAARAGIRSVLVSNFTWDWIYQAYPTFERLAPGVVARIADAYARATLALRLPLHGGFASTQAVTRDIPFIARRSRRPREEIRQALAIPPRRPAVLVSFGAYGADLPLDAIRASGAVTIVDEEAGFAAGFRYEDLVAAVDLVISKPGYGIVSECIANGTPLLYTSRGRFVEYDLMVAEMPRYLRCRFIAQEDLRAGRWGNAIEALLRQPPPPEQPRVDGADVAADAIVALLR